MTTHASRSLRRLIESLEGAPHSGLESYYPDTAAGQMVPRHRGQRVLWTRDREEMGVLAFDDGTNVPVLSQNVSATPENDFDRGKFSAILEAIRLGERPVFDPSAAHFETRKGDIHASLNDGNHRTLAAIGGGARIVWLRLSDAQRQDLDNERRYTDALYRAMRRAQKLGGVMPFRRRNISRLRGVGHERLRAAEARQDEVRDLLAQHQRSMLQRFGPAGGGMTRGTWIPLERQLESPQTFWRERLSELRSIGGRYYDEAIMHGLAFAGLYAEQRALFDELWDLRLASGLDPRTERLDPRTGEVARTR